MNAESSPAYRAALSRYVANGASVVGLNDEDRKALAAEDADLRKVIEVYDIWKA
ncbi:MAG: hypothetical protein IMZ67_05930, partial [Acidobacteria bacterium]|nr:hypothetical protein [Acidobacteriota bacterium]